MKIEEKMGESDEVKLGDDACLLNHVFAGDMYVREIFMKKGMLIVSKIHKHEHPYFIMSGEVSVLTESGVERIKSPHRGITKIGTKRVLYIHEDTIWATVHFVGEERDLNNIEELVIAKDFIELDEKLSLEGEL